ncbi:MAG: thioesterase family protein [Smithella sp.]|nr:thioesterase family protein [Smithella sp.]
MKNREGLIRKKYSLFTRRLISSIMMVAYLIWIHSFCGRGESNLSPVSEQKGWIKFKDDRPWDALSLLLIADSFPPPVLASHGIVAWVATIEYSVSIRDIPDTAWIKALFRSHYLTCDIVEEDGELWDENGKLLAISRQIAQFRKY